MGVRTAAGWGEGKLPAGLGGLEAHDLLVRCLDEMVRRTAGRSGTSTILPSPAMAPLTKLI